MDEAQQAEEARQSEEAQRHFLAKAEAVLAKHAETYRNEIPDLIEKMAALANAIATAGEEDTEAFGNLKRMAHDMKGQGAMFGLPDFAMVADSLSLLLAKGNKTHPHYLHAVKFHIDTLKRLQDERAGVQPAHDASLVQEAKHETDAVLNGD